MRNFRGSLDYYQGQSAKGEGKKEQSKIETHEDLFEHPEFGLISKSRFVMGASDHPAVQEEIARIIERHSLKEGHAIEVDSSVVKEFANVKLKRFGDIFSIEVGEVIQVIICVHLPGCIIVESSGEEWAMTIPNSVGKGTPLEREEIGSLQAMTSIQLEDAILEIPEGKEMTDMCKNVLVGLVEAEAEEFANHRNYLGKVIEHNVTIDNVDQKRIATRHIPVGVSVAPYMTHIDLACALAMPSNVEGVDVINISMGYYSAIHSKCLLQAISNLDVPVICSAGNDGTNNDCRYHWPSNFSIYPETPNVVAVGAVNMHGELVYNRGPKTVTLASISSFASGPEVGTSLAAAWTTKTIAAAMSLRSDVGVDLPTVLSEIDGRKNEPSNIFAVENTVGQLPIANQFILRPKNGSST